MRLRRQLGLHAAKRRMHFVLRLDCRCEDPTAAVDQRDSRVVKARLYPQHKPRKRRRASPPKWRNTRAKHRSVIKAKSAGNAP